MRLNYLNQKREDTIPPLLDLLARRPELRDVGIAGYLAGAAVDGAPGMPRDITPYVHWSMAMGSWAA